MGKLENISEAIDSLGMTAWGMAHCAHDGFTCSASMYLAFRLAREADPLAGGDYDEEAFHQAIIEAKRRGRDMIARLDGVLEREGVRHRTIPSGQDPDTLEAAFSKKRAAVLAGLGWIGKCTQLVTREHGPRVGLFTVLMDLEPPPPPPLAQAACGACTVCVEACTEGFLSGAPWAEGLQRGSMIDAFSCSRRMELLGEPLGHKHSCGLCLLACPLGGAAA